jgi:lipopolysaccharide/colanic/teichoic acid biosynthesis glycosyltransferase
MTPSRSSYPTTKRTLDLLVALTLLGPILVILAVAALAGLLCQGPPVLFTQQRIGRHGKPFRLVKLRTMAGPPARGRAYQEQHRLTRYGRLLRQLRIDELPQVLHLLTGTMSLVGPRPLLAEHLAQAGGGAHRHDVRPGFTCHAQLELVEHGYLDRHHQIRLDETYVERLSLRTDLAILWKTVTVLITPRRRRPPRVPLRTDHTAPRATRPAQRPVRDDHVHSRPEEGTLSAP